jgi:hypothetical protein
MTQGRCGSLGLHRNALSSSPPRRLIPAHLFVAQSREGINAGGAERGDATGE